MTGNGYEMQLYKYPIWAVLLAACVLASCSPSAEDRPETFGMSDEQVFSRFHQIWYEAPNTWRSTKWLGLGAAQNPMDVWVIQEILSEQKPDYFIECGAWQGGSAALWATILEHINSEAKVISIDIEDEMQQARELPIIQMGVRVYEHGDESSISLCIAPALFRASPAQSTMQEKPPVCAKTVAAPSPAQVALQSGVICRDPDLSGKRPRAAAHGRLAGRAGAGRGRRGSDGAGKQKGVGRECGSGGARTQGSRGVGGNP